MSIKEAEVTRQDRVSEARKRAEEAKKRRGEAAGSQRVCSGDEMKSLFVAISVLPFLVNQCYDVANIKRLACCVNNKEVYLTGLKAHARAGT